MDSSRKPDSAVFRLVNSALEGADPSAPTLALPKLTLAQVASELGRLRQLAIDDALPTGRTQNADRTPPPAAPIPPTQEWLTATEAVRYLGLPSCKALYQAIRRGQVPTHRLGKRRMRFRRTELDAVLERGRQASALQFG